MPAVWPYVSTNVAYRFIKKKCSNASSTSSNYVQHTPLHLPLVEVVDVDSYESTSTTSTCIATQHLRLNTYFVHLALTIQHPRLGFKACHMALAIFYSGKVELELGNLRWLFGSSCCAKPPRASTVTIQHLRLSIFDFVTWYWQLS